MENKNIEFEKLSEMCKYRGTKNTCSEDDNFSGECDDGECPIWNDLDIHDEDDD